MLNSYSDQEKKEDFISEDKIRELLYKYESNILNSLVYFSFEMNKVEDCIEY